MGVLTVIIKALLILGMIIAASSIYRGLILIMGKKIFISAIAEGKPVVISGKKLDTKNNIDLLEFIIFICDTSESVKKDFLDECLLMLKKLKTMKAAEEAETETDYSFMSRAKEHVKTALAEDIKYERACVIASIIFLVVGLIIYF